MSLCTIQTGRDPNRCTADCSQPGRFTTWTFSFKLSKPAKQRRLSLRDTFKKKRKIISAKLFNQWYRVQIWLSWWGSAAFTRWVHPSSLFLITFIDFTRIFFPPKRKELLVSMQSSRSTNATLLFFRSMKMKYSWLQRAIFERERRERDEDGEENSCHFDTTLKFSWRAGPLLGHLNSSSTCSLFEPGDQVKIAHLIPFPFELSVSSSRLSIVPPALLAKSLWRQVAKTWRHPSWQTEG